MPGFRTALTNRIVPAMASATFGIGVAVSVCLLHLVSGTPTTSIVTSLVAFLIGCAYSPQRSIWGTVLFAEGDADKRFHPRTKTVTVPRRRTTQSLDAPSRVAADDFHVEDWQLGESA
jgi:hypothetical protein